MKWFDIPTCFIFHTMNAFEQGDEVILDAARYDALWVKGSRDFSRPAFLSRYSLNMESGTSTVIRINEQAMEFPQINRQHWGRNYRYGYSLTIGMKEGHVAYDQAPGLIKFDMQTGTSQRHDFAQGVFPAEPFFVPATNATEEDHGYVLSYVYEPSTNTSDLWIMDAANISTGPVAKVKLPVRVPFGFHGVWVPEELI